MARKHSEDEVLRALRLKNDLKIEGNRIEVLSEYSTKRKNDLGNGSWGKIDFLVNYCGYYTVFVSAF